MVCVKGSTSNHCFSSDPIAFVLDGGWGEDWLTANDTTLGSDNGLGVAMALSVLDLPSTCPLPPIEALFTVDEETGLNGVQKLEGSLVSGRTLINLDTEQWGEICVGSAGTGTSEISLPVQRVKEPPESSDVLSVTVSGLLGGHSGSDINKDRGNAIKLLARAVYAVVDTAPGIVLVESFSGGELRNTIPKHAEARIIIPEHAMEKAQAVLWECACAFADEYHVQEKSLKLAWERCPGSPARKPLDVNSSKMLLRLLICLPHGVQKYSHSIAGLPETSCNLAVVSLPGGEAGEEMVKVTTTTRSSIPAALEAVRSQVKSVTELCGGTMIAKPAYSGWLPNLESPVLSVTKLAYTEILGKDPVIKASHAGLECGVLCGILPGLDAVSIGPEIRGAHSVDERAQISTVASCYALLLNILERLGQK